MKNYRLLIISTLITLNSCPYFQPDPINDPETQITDVYPAVYNLKDINTKYDEYNPGPKYWTFKKTLSTETEFVYSTNSGTEGNNFDIWKGKINLEQKSRLRNEKNTKLIVNSKKISPFFKNETSSDSNEYGPYLFYNPKTELFNVTPPNVQIHNFDASESEREAKNKQTILNNSLYFGKTDDTKFLGDNLYFFASDRSGDLDIYYYSPKFGIREFFGNKKGSNERYFSYDYRRHTLYFASDRDGKYDIYKYENKTNKYDFENIFNNNELSKDIVKVDELNSDNNDTCPVVIDDYLVFASDRPQGKGGYDIYISDYGLVNDSVGNGWLKPKNIQDIIDKYYKNKGSNIPKDELKDLDLNINTKYDEFRPFIIENDFNSQYVEIKDKFDDSYNEQLRYGEFGKQKSMIFSSNRPEGKGGFDLYLGILPDLDGNH